MQVEFLATMVIVLFCVVVVVTLGILAFVWLRIGKEIVKREKKHGGWSDDMGMGHWTFRVDWSSGISYQHKTSEVGFGVWQVEVFIPSKLNATRRRWFFALNEKKAEEKARQIIKRLTGDKSLE